MWPPRLGLDLATFLNIAFNYINALTHYCCAKHTNAMLLVQDLLKPACLLELIKHGNKILGGFNYPTTIKPEAEWQGNQALQNRFTAK